MPPLKTRNLFISHSWPHSDAYQKLVGLLDAAPNFSYKNYSVPKDHPVHDASNVAQLYQAIKNHVTPCHIVIIMAGVYASYSKWIEREIKIATDEFGAPKAILAVKPWGNRNVSTLVSKNANKIVGWNTSSIVGAIRELVP